MSQPDDKPKTNKYVRAILAFILSFKNPHDDILPGGWMLPVNEFNLDAGEFYDRVEQLIAERNYPELEISRVVFAQGGLLSKRQEYLRVMRERFAIDTCAATFGRDYFFSCRIVHAQARVRLWHLLALGVFLYCFGKLLLPSLGFNFTAIALAGLLFAVAAVFRNASASPFSNIDRLLLKIPVVGKIYENWFRVETYYRMDTRELFQSKLPALIKAVAEEFAGEKGLKAVGPGELPPTVTTLHKP